MQVLQAQVLVVARVQVETGTRFANVALMVCGAGRGARARHGSCVAVAERIKHAVVLVSVRVQMNANILGEHWMRYYSYPYGTAQVPLAVGIITAPHQCTRVLVRV